MNPPRGKPRGIAERGFAPMSVGGIHPRSKPRGIVPSRLNHGNDQDLGAGQELKTSSASADNQGIHGHGAGAAID